MKSELLGRVRSVRTETSLWDLATETWQAPTLVKLEEYREDGKISVSEHREVSRSTYKYDQAGRLAEIQISIGDANAGRVAYEYDESDRLIRTVQYPAAGAGVVMDDRTYAADGSYVSVQQIPAGVTDVYCPIDGADYYFSAPGVRERIVVYDPKDRATEVLLKNAEGEVLRRFVLTHTESGRLVRDELQRDGQSASITAEYTYDELGRRTAAVRRLFGLSEERQTYSYDDRGNQTEVVNNRGQTRFTYRYDAHGNWIERLTSGRHEQDADFTTGSIDRREIAYYS